ncbi:aspartate aminotransferase family protein [Sporolactobacillus nakayamae]|uniref:(S)-3-amino-2-methylpropionate transaminase n=1 Tax=Sporolactobacillus nakayamae TaxID=269670 RepID=A0A1I2T2H5_9BACL|nr:aspartate aminotransferase family protein [Sporolactobacillus nakayamae]SFG56471.1 4-aminobutyrate aminotransferase apoenzyme [Sporolactobacillus nakayamae]
MDDKAMSLYERAIKVIPPVASNRATKLEIVKAKGAYLWDTEGKKYLDFASGIGVTNMGHNHPYVIEKAKAQMEDLVHAGHNVVFYPSYVELAERLSAELDHDYKVYFSNSGAEAVEGALKLAKWATKRPGIISFKRSFHGRTMGATTVTASSSVYRQEYEGLMPSVYYAEYPYAFRSGLSEDAEVDRCIQSIEEIFHYLIAPEKVAAIIMEPQQGEGGYIVPPKRFVEQVRQICSEHGILLIFDEIQSGFGRTGELFAWQNFNVEPDIMCAAKGIANGFPLSAVIGKNEVMDQWTAGAHGGTFGGNPVSCAAGLAVLDLLHQGVLENAKKMGVYFKERLEVLAQSFSIIKDIRGLGLMIGMECMAADGKPDSDIIAKLRETALAKGLLLLSCGVDKNVIRFIPPLVVTKEEIDLAVSILQESFEEILAKTV